MKSVWAKRVKDRLAHIVGVHDGRVVYHISEPDEVGKRVTTARNLVRPEAWFRENYKWAA